MNKPTITPDENAILAPMKKLIDKIGKHYYSFAELDQIHALILEITKLSEKKKDPNAPSGT